MPPDTTSDPEIATDTAASATGGAGDGTDESVDVLIPESSNKYHAVTCGQINNPGNAERMTLREATDAGHLGASCCTPGRVEWPSVVERQREVIATVESDHPDPDPDYEPVGQERLVLAIMRDEGRAPSRLIRMRAGFDAQRVTELTGSLVDHKWLRRVKRPDENEYGRVNDVHAFFAYNAPEGYDPFAPPSGVADGDGDATEASDDGE